MGSELIWDMLLNILSLKIEVAFDKLRHNCCVIKVFYKNHLYQKSLLKSYGKIFQFSKKNVFLQNIHKCVIELIVYESITEYLRFSTETNFLMHWQKIPHQITQGFLNVNLMLIHITVTPVLPLRVPLALNSLMTEAVIL